jgi:hypothetical protein
MINSGNGIYPKFIIKTVNQSVTNSTTLVNDNKFTITFPGNSIYEIVLVLGIAGDGGDFKCKWAVSGGVAQLTTRALYGTAYDVAYPYTATVQSISRNLADTINYGTNATYGTTVIERFLVTVPTSGTLTFQWAQDNANATPTTVCGYRSYMKITKVNL